MQPEEKSLNSNTKHLLEIVTDVSKEIKFNPSIEQSLKNIISKEGYINYEVFKKRLLTNNASFTADLYEVSVTGETEDSIKETNIFLKNITPDVCIKRLIDVQSSYANEVFFYTDLKYIFDELQESAKIPEGQRFKTPKCYDESNTDTIILENLTRRGFKTLNRTDVVTLNFSELAITQLAKFHGLSFVLKHKRKEYFQEKIKTRKCPFYFTEQWKNFVREMCQYSLKYFNEDIQKKIENFLSITYEKLPKYYGGETNSVRCLCHGDFKSNNVLMKENEEDSEVVIIDYQLLFYGSPVLDLICFIVYGTDQKFRKDYLDQLKNLYHRTLTDFLKYFDLDVNHVYPKNVFEVDFEESLDYGLMIALYAVILIFKDDEVELTNFEKGDTDGKSVKIHENFKDRITGIIDDYLNWGIL